MAGTISKRQQARNEKVLHDLVQTVPGNNLCADCSARNPAWASWSLGIFLCVRCASIHRKLGTHISKIKSLSMDSWTAEQVENMRKVGNVTSNKIYNPQNKKPSIPIDVDEVDSVMERFIRAKYVSNSFNGGGRRGGLTTGISVDENPPPLPPKGKFGLRSASSLFPLSSKAKKQASSPEILSPTRETLRRSPSPRLVNKPSKVFGASIEYDTGDTDYKLGRLRDMGFMDNSRNAMILKGVHGNLEKAIETLIRLGEGGSRSPSLVSPRESSLRATRSLTPLSSRATTNGRDTPITPPAASPAVSTNPFDMLTPQPQTAQSTGTLQNKNASPASTNPFGPPSNQADLFSQAFQNMSLAPPQQPLFPNHTGGIPSQPGQLAHNQPLSGIAPGAASMSFNTNQTYSQLQPLHVQQIYPQQTGLSPTSAQSTPGLAYNHNPFFMDQVQTQAQVHVQVQAQMASQQPLAVNTATSPSFANNPFTRSPTRIQSPTLGQIPEQSQYVTSPSQQTNPFFAQAQYQQAPVAQQAQTYSQRPDKASILALYNYPQLAPQPMAQAEQLPMSTNAIHANAASAGNPEQPRSVSTPLSGNRNPFAINNGTTSPATSSPLASKDIFSGGLSHGSRDSIALGMDMASWSNSGRHSPDAFASLSARHT
ncbi:hypothetical protein jhhlp_006260 [Lomentospora prolificans]|uniref:Arf-GAP domain-containing protein n=1 Tax=Lomentospora prolificans TaxID=41688 RepID=A0A2N3N5G8_9PEZI|nr:hypothetical protein jhhlp_006260 [Lomentospora prolificans]